MASLDSQAFPVGGVEKLAWVVDVSEEFDQVRFVWSQGGEVTMTRVQLAEVLSPFFFGLSNDQCGPPAGHLQVYDLVDLADVSGIMNDADTLLVDPINLFPEVHPVPQGRACQGAEKFRI